MGNIFKLILDSLPFSGQKTKLFAWLTGAAVTLQAYGIDPQQVVGVVLENPSKAGLIGLAISLVHQVLKARFPEVKVK
jgi:hypothetical protein